MEMEKIFENLGLTPKEAKVYMTLSGLGSSTAYLVAQRSGLKKPTTYVVLDSLIVRLIEEVFL